MSALFHFAGLWAVVNNAGVSWTGEVEWTDLRTYEKIYSVNVFGTIRMTKSFLPLIRESRGRVVNVASMAGELRNQQSIIIAKDIALGQLELGLSSKTR
jgi:NAD(P)-dependent dehydrogenase (short-subunit alcohol dehydrogenase family)